MFQVNPMIQRIKSLEYSEKLQLLQYLVQTIQRDKSRFSPEDQQSLLAFTYEEAENMLRDIPQASCYRDKDIIFDCEDCLMGIVMHLAGSPDKLPPLELQKLKALAETVDRERYIERTLDDIWQQDTITETDINRLLYWVKQTQDEYQKGKLYLGLIHYRKNLKKLNQGASAILTDYIASEFRRLMDLGTEDAWGALELVADISRDFSNEAMIGCLQEVLTRGHNHVSYYALASLTAVNAQLPQDAIDALAEDLVYANLLYGTLQRAGKADRFPAQYATEEYLAKSDLVHWLTYPTELGKEPDEIVYIGRIKPLFKKEVFHVFKFRSDSETLARLKNKWLIGWSSNEGSTFSEFEEFAPYENLPTKKVLNRIKKQIV